MRINILEEDATVNTIATELGMQSPWTFCFTAAGRAKFVSTRAVFKNPVYNATIKYTDLKNSLKRGLTDEKNVRNNLTIKSRWFAEREHYMDEEIIKNTTSRSQYDERKDTYEWKNICSEQQIVNYIVREPVVNGSTDGVVGGQKFGQAAATGIPAYTDKVRRAIANPVTYMKEHLSGVFTEGNGVGLLSQQHHKISKAVLPGTKHQALELGDIIRIDDTGFAARNIKVGGESFTGKRWLITDITSTEDSVTINRAIQIMERRILPIPIEDEWSDV